MQRLAHPLEARLAKLVRRHHGTANGRYYAAQLLELQWRWDARCQGVGDAHGQAIGMKTGRLSGNRTERADPSAGPH